MDNANVRRTDHEIASQIAQNYVCSSSHSLEQRFARWLLEISDLSGSETVPLKQDALADLIGARRTSLSGVASAFDDGELVRTFRGGVSILDRPGLKRMACSCYAPNDEARFKSKSVGEPLSSLPSLTASAAM